jgi:hypothetical protein
MPGGNVGHASSFVRIGGILLLVGSAVNRDRHRPPIGHNVRLSADTWDPQLNAPHPGCICSSGTFIGDYFGIDSNGTNLYTTSVSTFNAAGENPSHYQQQVVAKVPIP